MQLEIEKKRNIDVCKRIDRQLLFISAVTSFLFLYFVDPLDNVNLLEWDRTFCSAIISGISIEKRIRNFYMLFLLWFPLIYSIVLIGYALLFNNRNKYKESYLKFSILILFSVIACYISRYAVDSKAVCGEEFIEFLLAFLIMLTVIALIDKKQIFCFSDLTELFVGFMMLVISSNILLRVQSNISILIIGTFFICYVLIVYKSSFGMGTLQNCRRLLFVFMWLPAIIRLILEGIFFLNEKGKIFSRYYTYIGSASLVFLIMSIAFIFFLQKKNINFSTFGYIGAITSIGAISFFAYTYQYKVEYFDYTYIYEMGNVSTAIDSIQHGKLPIIDYFSAHALSDVWTKILYCVIHSDIKGIFADPYGGISTILGLFCLYYIVKEIFDKDIAIIFICLFPYYYYGIKVSSLCIVSVALLVYILNHSTPKAYFLFWISVLVSAFITYDEGISLGIACILAYIISIYKEHDKLKDFILKGIIVGCCTLLLFFCYAVATGIPVISRIKEWISVSAGSNTSWATENFGDPSQLAFLIAYFIIPIGAVSILIFTTIKFIKNKQYPVLAIITIAFAFTEVIYITRTIVYHNLAVSLGLTGVLLNYVHWTVSLFFLYLLECREGKYYKKLLVWIGAFGTTIILEGALVTGVLPNSDSVIFARASVASENWKLRNNTMDNWKKERIVYDESLISFIDQFNRVFDTVLTEKQTFIDFADITSLYALTGRTRPCYVGQTPSLLTNLYSQECYLSEIAKYDCPLAILGTTDENYIQQMVGIPHNIRYYKIAEYIYKRYRPLIRTGDFVIWCEKKMYDEYADILKDAEIEKLGYVFVDYGYDPTTYYVDENGNDQIIYQPYHFYDLKMIPYILANYDNYRSCENEALMRIENRNTDQKIYTFTGSQSFIGESDGNYIKFRCINPGGENIESEITFQDSSVEGIQYKYQFTVLPGDNTYMIRTSQDYFWSAFNIDTIYFECDEKVNIEDLEILSGD